MSPQLYANRVKSDEEYLFGRSNLLDFAKNEGTLLGGWRIGINNRFTTDSQKAGAV